MPERRIQRPSPVVHLMGARLLVDGSETTGKVLDLNNAGAFIATDLHLETNTRIEVELQLAGENKSLPLKALVTRCSDVVVGKRHVIPAGLELVFMAENVMERAFIQKAVLEVLKGSLATAQTSPVSASSTDESVLR